jgi:hypothetical protein
MKPSVYIETTVISYLTAWQSRDVIRVSRQMITREWWTRYRTYYDLYVSDFVIEEASRGDPIAVAERLKALVDIPLLTMEPAALELAQRLAASLALPTRARLDAAHVAIAATHGIEFLLTWNCRHLANGALADKIEQTCADAGFVAPRILTPELLMEPP